MRRSLWIALAVVLVGGPIVRMLGVRSVPAWVVGRNKRIFVMQSTGQWYHDYSRLFGIANATASANGASDSLTLDVSRNQFDVTRAGARVRLNRVAFLSQISSVSDSASRWQTLARFVEARVKSYAIPASVSPLRVQVPGLARVVAVHPVQRRQFFWQKSDKGSSNRSRWMHLVEVEFRAMRVRNVVRTIDVIDAGSIPGLHAGDIVQMHFDPREPKVLRLGDGMRTFGVRGH